MSPFVSLLALLALAPAACAAAADDAFPDMIQFLTRYRRLRLHYEVSSLDRNQQYTFVRSALVDEAYDFERRAGRILVEDSDQELASFNTFYWRRDRERQVTHTMRPFRCATFETRLDDPQLSHTIPGLSDQMSHYLRRGLDGDFVGHDLHGLAGLMSRVSQEHAHQLRLIYRSDDQSEFRWRLELGAPPTFEFRLRKFRLEAPLDFDNLASLTVLQIEDAASGPQITQLNLLNIKYDFDARIFDLPEGYNCGLLVVDHMDVAKDVAKFRDPKSSWRRLTTVEVSVLDASGGGVGLVHVADNSEPAEPLDSMLEPRVESSVVGLLEDSLDKLLATSSHLGPGGQSSTKSIWDLRSGLVRELDLRTGTCARPRVFSSHHLVDSDQTTHQSGLVSVAPPPQRCDREGVSVRISEQFTMRLTADTLKFLTLELQDRAKTMNIAKLLATDAGYELTYESSVSKRLCLYRNNNAEQLELDRAILVTRFSCDKEARICRPLSSSLLVYLDTWAGVSLQIDVRPLRRDNYSPWTHARHQLDLESCFLGARQSASLWLDYQLSSDDRDSIARAIGYRQELRQALASHFRTSYSVSWARIPAIEVHLVEDGERGHLLRVKARLLDREHLVADSERVPARAEKPDDGEYMGRLRAASRSVLAPDLERCAEYCELYKCRLYVFCPLMTSCYVFAGSRGADEQLGSYQSLSLACNAYRVKEHRVDAANKWRKYSWSLPEILESVAQVVNHGSRFGNVAGAPSFNEDADPVENMTKTSRTSVSKPSVYMAIVLYSHGELAKSRMLTLDPTFARYEYDNVDEDLTRSEEPNPLDMGAETEASAYGIVSNFRVALSGYEYIIVRPAEAKVTPTHGAHAEPVLLGDLDASYILVEHHEPEYCSRLCLADPDCSSYSFCADQASCVLAKLDPESAFDDLLIGDDDNDERRPSGIAISPSASCVIMKRTYVDQFQRLEPKFPFAYSQESAALLAKSPFKASSGEDCALQCYKPSAAALAAGSQTEPTCLSFDFCRPLRSESPGDKLCILYNRHVVSKSPHGDQVKHDVGGSWWPREAGGETVAQAIERSAHLEAASYCWHYTRNFLADFHRVSHRRLPNSWKLSFISNHEFAREERGGVMSDVDTIGSASLVASGDDNELDTITLAGCARLCERESSCGSFEFCVADFEKAPDGLYLSCSLGNHETLNLTPHGPDEVQELNGTKLIKSAVCSVYTYKSLSTILAHKRKSLTRPLLERAERESKAGAPSGQSGTPLVLLATVLASFYVVGVVASNARQSLAKLNQDWRRREPLIESLEEIEMHLGHSTAELPDTSSRSQTVH